MYRYLLVMVFLMQLNVYGQIDQKKLDSLARSIDSSAKTHKSWQDSFTKVQDSIYSSAINKNNSPTVDDLAEQKRKETKQRQQILLRIVISVVLLITGFVVLLRRRKNKT
jgi:hypothetical protein